MQSRNKILENFGRNMLEFAKLMNNMDQFSFSDDSPQLAAPPISVTSDAPIIQKFRYSTRNEQAFQSTSQRILSEFYHIDLTDEQMCENLLNLLHNNL